MDLYTSWPARQVGLSRLEITRKWYDAVRIDAGLMSRFKSELGAFCGSRRCSDNKVQYIEVVCGGNPSLDTVAAVR